MKAKNEGIIFDIQRWSLHDGPGIRTNVFLKGCPLSCKWCSNPESQDTVQELALFTSKCIACKRCIHTCPHQAISSFEVGHSINYEICRSKCYKGDGGFACTSQCYAQALKVIGDRTPLDEIMKEVLSDKKLYEKNGGGITITGGEPFAQPQFLLEILKASKDNGLHTVIETCGFTNWAHIEAALPYVDFLFVDFKLYDEEKHIKYTGVSNRIIMKNLYRLNEYAKKHTLTLAIRTPVIPGINDSKEEIDKIAKWIKANLSEVNIYQLLPYHRLGRGKYHDIGKEYELAELELPTDEHMKQLEQLILDNGIKIKYE